MKEPGSAEARRNAIQLAPDPSTLDPEEVVRIWGSDLENGLRSSEAARRLERDGPNELRAAPPTPRWRRLLAQFQDPLTYLLLAAIAVALLAWRIEGGGQTASQGEWPVSMAADSATRLGDVTWKTSAPGAYQLRTEVLDANGQRVSENIFEFEIVRP